MKGLPITTERLILRPVLQSDTQGMFLLDSDPRVHEYLGKQPIRCYGRARAYIDFIQQQYEERGIGRWATIEKETGAFIGWSGLKLNTEEVMNGHSNYYDIGYRFRPEFWGKGYATEASIAARDYFFEHFPTATLVGIAHVENKASCRVLEKIGLQRKEEFFYSKDAMQLAWFESK